VAEDDTEKTEEPTPERRRKARDEGQFPRGKDAGNTVAGLAVLITLATVGPKAMRTLHQFSVRCFNDPYDLTRGDPRALLHAVATTIGVCVFPAVVAAALGALAIGIAEAGFHPNTDLVSPKWNRLDPLPKLKQMFALHETGPDVILQLARVTVVMAVAYSCVKGAFPRLLHLERVGLEAGVIEILTALYELGLWCSLALAGLALLDYLKAYRKHEKSIMMSRQELKEEMKQQEGDPRIKQRQRAKAREAARRNLSKAIAQSDFVITNPTHIAVALRYRMAEGAPVVTAKGYDEAALYIRKLAKEANIPVLENKPLARALAKRVKQGRPVPVDLYAAVAEILAFVYRLKNRNVRGGPPAPGGARRPAAPPPGGRNRGPGPAGPRRPPARGPRPPNPPAGRS
jgi:flagellar biosynthesis protein FlhB